MSIDTSWSANSLQRPVQAHLTRINQMPMEKRADFRNKIIGGFKTPEEQAWAARHVNQAQDYQELTKTLPAGFLGQGPMPPGWAAKHQNAVNKTRDALTAKVMATGGTLPGVKSQFQLGQPVKPGVPVVGTPGISPAISTALPTIPEASVAGVPKVAPLSGWLSPGMNFQIR